MGDACNSSILKMVRTYAIDFTVHCCICQLCKTVNTIIPLQVNCNDDNGILFGKWDDPYTDGVYPGKWNGSVAILRQWNNNNYQPVCYGQCWVFAAVACTGTGLQLLHNYKVFSWIFGVHFTCACDLPCQLQLTFACIWHFVPVFFVVVAIFSYFIAITTYCSYLHKVVYINYACFVCFGPLTGKIYRLMHTETQRAFQGLSLEHPTLTLTAVCSTAAQCKLVEQQLIFPFNTL